MHPEEIPENELLFFKAQLSDTPALMLLNVILFSSKIDVVAQVNSCKNDYSRRY